MLIDAFKPVYQGTITVSVTGSSSTTALVGGGDSIEVQNTSATVTVFVETGSASVTAAVASGYPILPGQSKVIRRKQVGDPGQAVIGQMDTHIATIGSAAGPTTFYATSGVGT